MGHLIKTQDVGHLIKSTGCGTFDKSVECGRLVGMNLYRCEKQCSKLAIKSPLIVSISKGCQIALANLAW